MELIVRTVDAWPDAGPVEIVERKGLGHPDTLCDTIAERVSIALCRHYLDRFGAILHHNVDKVLLCGGASRPRFGGGEILEPIEIYLAGRATAEWQGATVPVDELAISACREVLVERLGDARGVRVVSRIRPGSADLTRLFARGHVPLANDTSCGVGFAPATPLERAVLAVERTLNDRSVKTRLPALGSDVKVMGVRRRDRIDLTIACAIIDRHVGDLAAYVAARTDAGTLAAEVATNVASLPVTVAVNAADDPAREDVYLTVTGTSAEAGDDGEVGRGNRTNGLITPYRPMTMEAAAGKNPVSHVGKLYGIAANRIAAAIVAELPESRAASCTLSSQIGAPITEPTVVDIALACAPDVLRRRVDDIVHRELTALLGLADELVRGTIALF